MTSSPTAVPEVGSLWVFPPWTNPNYAGPWRVERVGLPTMRDDVEFVGDGVKLVNTQSVFTHPDGFEGRSPHWVPLLGPGGWPGRWVPASP